MLLSINIPTYNRSFFLKKNLEELVRQIKELNAHDEMEINISNNGSTDNTDTVVMDFISNNKDIHIGYNHFDENQGPDKNFIYTMHMSHGDYTILLGDDDYIVDGGVQTIIDLIKSQPKADVFLSNRTEIDEEGNFLREHSFLYEKTPSRIFDFSDENQAGFYFSLCKNVGGCLTFISSIIYKSSILTECGNYDGSLDGTFYSFWFYLWGKLSRGGTLYYYNGSYILNTQTTNANFGNGLKRSLVEFEGFQRVSDLYFFDKTYKYSFLQVPKRCKPMYMLAQECIYDKDSYNIRLLPVLEKNDDIAYAHDLKMLNSVCYHLSCLANLVLPTWLMRISRYLRIR